MTVAQIEQVAPVLFLAFAALTVLSAWAIVLSQNIVRMAIYLLFTLGGVAGLYMMMDAQFLAAIQLVVYAGGTLILIVFGVMLTSKSPFMHLTVSGRERIVACGLAALFAALLIFAVIQTPPGSFPLDSPEADVSAVDGGGVAAGDVTGPTVAEIGMALISAYVVPFEVAAVLLLLVMIAAAYMARRRTAAPNDQDQEHRHA